VEVAVTGIAVGVAVIIWAASTWLASNWLEADAIATGAVAHALALMGLVIALQFVESVYVSSIVGLQRQVLQNALSSVIATARALGAVGVLIWISPTIEAFFVWQAIISFITVVLFFVVAYRALPPPPRRARPSFEALLSIRRFAGGTTVITLLSLLLTQTDKILLARVLSLEKFAYYALAGVAANSLYMFVAPISAAIYPRLTEIATRGDHATESATYHRGAQMVTVLMGSAAVMLMTFGERALLLWTADPVLSDNVAPLLTLLALGTLFNGLMYMPGLLQLAHGWTSLTIAVNSVAVALLVPSLFFVVAAHGAMGAAWVWVILNAGYLLFAISFMHRRLLPTEKWRWYLQDVFYPLSAGALLAVLLRWALPSSPGRIGDFLIMSISGSCVFLGMAAAAPLVRRQFALFLPKPKSCR
jgi:O-antigen/teichoic acid export membrane protein